MSYVFKRMPSPVGTLTLIANGSGFSSRQDAGHSNPGPASRPSSLSEVGKIAMAQLRSRAASGLSHAASEGIKQSFGGKIATAIESAQSQSGSAGQIPVFGGDHIAAGNDEVEDFVNQKPPQD